MFDLSKLFEQEMKPSLGCTEPVAVGNATSLAYNAIWGRMPEWLQERYARLEIELPDRDELELTEIQVLLDRDIYKNALAVGIPRSGGKKGIAIAAAMGLFCYPTTPEQQKTLFDTLDPRDLEKAQALADKVRIGLVDDWEERDDIYIQVTVILRPVRDASRAIVGRARIENSHDNVTYVGAFESRGGEEVAQEPPIKNQLSTKTICEIVASLGAGLSADVAERMAGMLEMNLAASDAGLVTPGQGMGVGLALRELVQAERLGSDPVTLAQIMVAAAADARMGGADCGVMSTAGSGNQGITASLPLVAVAVKNGWDVRQLLRKRRQAHLSPEESAQLGTLLTGLAISNAVTSYVTYHTNYLSSMCGCAVKAGMGATAGIAYLLSEDCDTVEAAIQNMAGNITGLICDGAKEGCALKLTTAASVAVTSALLAARGVRIPSDNGIVAEKVEDTIQNVGSVCKMMARADREIVSIMRKKAARGPSALRNPG